MWRHACTLALVLTLGCREELDSEPAADPLEDPWVESIEEEPPALVVAAPSSAESTPAPAPPATAGPGLGVIASPSAVPSSPSPSQTGKSSAPGPTEPTPSEPAELPVPEAAPSQPTQVEPAPAPVEPATPPPPSVADFAGSYRFVGGAAQREDLEQAIEEAAGSLNAAIRGIGRRRLTKTNPIDDKLEIVVAGDRVQTIFSTGFDAECVLDGGTVKWTSKDGDQYKVRVRQKGSKLVQIIEGVDGVKTTVFVLSSDRKSLTVHHKIEADRLPVAMTYRLSYSRK